MRLTEHLTNSFSRMVTEAVKSSDFKIANDKIIKILSKKQIYNIPSAYNVYIDGKAKRAQMFFTSDNKGFAIVYVSAGMSVDIQHILFTSNFDDKRVSIMDDEPVIWDVCLDCKGASMTSLVNLIIGVAKNKVALTNKGIKDEISKSQLYESLDISDIQQLMENAELAAAERERMRLYMKVRNLKKRGLDASEYEGQLNDAKKRLSEIKTQVRNNVSVTVVQDKTVEQAEMDLEEDRATPEERFTDMEFYVKRVALGFRPLVVVCGAPGVGKTFRIMSLVKSLGKVKGTDYNIIKGKSTAANLYMQFHDFKNKGQLTIIDDADEVVKDPIAINLIKAACDSSDERWVSYGTSRPPEMSEEKAAMCDDAVFEKERWFYPKEFLMEGGLIIITNMGAGMLDTAIKNRALLCDLNFTTDEVLDLVEKLSPNIKPNELTKESKTRAIDYLRELASNGSPMEISIRSFCAVAEMYCSDAPEKDIQRRIREQMRLLFDRRKSKY